MKSGIASVYDTVRDRAAAFCTRTSRDARAGRRIRVDAERQPGNLRELAGGGGQPRDAVFERRDDHAAGDAELADDVAERMDLRERAAGERPRRVDAVAADAAAVDHGRVAARGGAHGVGDEIAEVGFRRAQPRRCAPSSGVRFEPTTSSSPAPSFDSYALTTSAVFGSSGSAPVIGISS